MPLCAQAIASASCTYAVPLNPPSPMLSTSPLKHPNCLAYMLPHWPVTPHLLTCCTMACAACLHAQVSAAELAEAREALIAMPGAASCSSLDVERLVSSGSDLQCCPFQAGPINP